MRRAYAVVIASALLMSSRAKADQEEDAVSRAIQPLRTQAAAVWSQCPQPSYPVEAARAGTTGMTRLAYQVDTDGSG